MKDTGTLTAEHSSWEWELVHQFEDGSIPPDNWSTETLTVVASWYAKRLPRAEAAERFEKYYHRNHHRLTHRLGTAPVATNAIEAVDAAWESLLARALDGAKR